MPISLQLARDYVTSTTPTDAPQDSFVHAAHVDLYRASSDADKQRLSDAMEALLLGGTDWEQQMAGAFFNTVGAPPSLIDHALAAYASTPTATLADVIASQWFALSAAQAQTARTLFVSDPSHHVQLAAAALAHDDGTGWDALTKVVAASTDPTALASAFKAAYSTDRESEFFAAMKSRPPDLIRATAALLSAASAPKLLAACNLGLH